MAWFGPHLLCVACVAGHFSTIGGLELVNNGYEDLVVAIADTVPEDDRYRAELEGMVTDASKYMYEATRHRAYIRSVKILIPKTWADNSSYTNPGGASFDKAEIRIDDPSPVFNDNPYTFQPGQCGEPGEFIHLTPDFVMDNPGVERDRNWGNPGRMLVHEFAHLRWGVFDEYGSKDDPQHPVAYLGDNGKVEPTACTPGMAGHWEGSNCSINPSNNLPWDCDFFPDEDNNTAIASIMYSQLIPSVTQFCESHPSDPRLQHNMVAPNMQNKMCNARGTWDVIVQHKDFSDNNNPPRPVTSTVPHFSYVYSRRGYWYDGTEKCGRRVVLMLDMSGSMRHYERWFKQSQTADKFMRDVLPVGSNVGIVKFSTNASVWLQMTPLKNKAMQNILADNLPTYREIGGETGIGKAFITALDMLNKTGSTQGGRILLITDGEETEDPRVVTMMADIIASGVVVHTVAYGAAASSYLADISQKTGGMYAYFSGSDVSTSLDSSIQRLWADMAVCEEQTQVEVFRKSVDLQIPNFDYNGYVDIDDSLGQDTEFVFTFPRGSDIEVHVTSPNDDVYDRNSAGYSFNTKLYIGRLKLQVYPNNTGNWMYTLRNKADIDRLVGITVTSKPRDKKSTYEFRTWLSGLDVNATSLPVVYAHVHIGYSPVVFANVRISIEQPNGNITVVVPQDNGLPPDNTKNDGVYTAYVTSITGNDRYSLDASVSNIPGKTALLQSGYGSSKTMSRSQKHFRGEVLKLTTTNFSRTMALGSIVAKQPQNSMDTRTITDLRGQTIDPRDRIVRLTWRLPRTIHYNNSETGYDLRVSSSSPQLMTSFHKAIPVDNSFRVASTIREDPKGTLHTMTLKIPTSFKEHSVVFGIKYFDSNGTPSEMSNVVVIGIQGNKMLPENTSLTHQFRIAAHFGLFLATVTSVLLVYIIVAKGRQNNRTDIESLITM